MLDHDQLMPEETQGQNRLLMQDLSHYYDTRVEDNISLARIRARLLQKTATSLPLADEDGRTRFPKPSRGERGARMKYVHTFVRDRARHPFLSALAAAVLLVALIGSFALVLRPKQGTITGSDSPAGAHGWTVVARFTGTGSQTITGQDIVGHRFGWFIKCTNTTNVTIGVELSGQELEGSSGKRCLALPEELLWPENMSSSLEPGRAAVLQTIKVTAPSSTSWELVIFKGAYHPPLSIDTTNWHALADEMDGTGPSSWSISVTLPKTWGLQFVCHGAGTLKVGFLLLPVQPGTPDNPPASVSCNGQLHFESFDGGGQDTRVFAFDLEITTGIENDWQAVLVGCTNGKPHCGMTTTTPTP